MRFLLDRGWQVVPVNPRLAGGEILGQRVRSSLAEVEQPIDIVDVFRRAVDTPAIADEVVRIRAKTLWLQSGIVNEEAAAAAAAGGVMVVMDACIGTLHSLLRVPRR